MDIETLNTYAERVAMGYDPEEVMESIHARSRDNARTPIQWTAGENAGFTTGKPWMPINPNHVDINAEAALADPDSVFHYYRKLIRLRKAYDVFRRGTFTLLCPEDEKIFAYTRDTEEEHILVVCNFTDETLTYDVPSNFWGSEMLINNYAEDSHKLRPYETVILYYHD